MRRASEVAEPVNPSKTNENLSPFPFLFPFSGFCLRKARAQARRRNREIARDCDDTGSARKWHNKLPIRYLAGAHDVGSARQDILIVVLGASGAEESGSPAVNFDFERLFTTTHLEGHCQGSPPFVNDDSVLEAGHLVRFIGRLWATDELGAEREVAGAVLT
ncbi:hypothetical protein BJY00DRAFT_278904 [Aspergillus carlsbadensis]|nr:hypothetical protein BJY00DRAFT_278904 [Aspergillus carlsbadensis]